jgi:predicted dehydrogenase
MKTVRFGIIGMGNMGFSHARNFLEGRIPRATLTAVADVSPAMTARVPSVPAFADAGELIRSGLVDAVIIATPHYFHTTDGIAALEAGLHVVIEKPLSVHKADCERVIAAYRPGKQIFSVMFNQRTDPVYVKLRELIRSGELGALRRIQWTVTDWFRTQAYYDSGGWRATWAGEGGGVLLNQSPHNLDLWQWLFGVPARIRAFATFGRYHNIEVEDDVTAYMEYDDGMTGTLITSTGESPGTNRLEIVAEQGRIVVENRVISYLRNEVPMTKFSHTTTAAFSRVPTWEVTIPAPGENPHHVGVMKNVVEAILDGAPLMSPGPDGIHSVEMANAMLLSAYDKETIAIPMDSARYEKWLQARIAESKVRKTAAPVKPGDDFSKSFK